MSAALPDRLPAAPWRERAGLDTLCEALGADADEARFVGGAVRDSLLGLPVKDVDIATIHPPQEVIRRIRRAGFKAVPTGLAHGTITAVLDHWPVEITTLRRDVSTDGRRATIAFATDWREDAARRDFTMNALYADVRDGRLHDYFDGRTDLAARRVRFIGDALARIDEDHLRILRYFRFTARFGVLDRASADYAACVTRAASLMALSRERIADELLRLLGLPEPGDVIAAMIADGVLAAVLPDVGEDGVAALCALILAEREADCPPDGLRRLAALLSATPVLAEQIGAQLRFSNKARARLRAMLAPSDATTPEGLAYRLGTQGAIDHILLGRTFAAGDIAGLRDWSVPRMPVSGGDLIALGLPAGPQVATALRVLERQWIAAGFPPAKQTRAMAAQMIVALLRAAQ